MLDKMKRCPVFDDDSQDMLSTITKKIEDRQLKIESNLQLKHVLTKACQKLCQKILVRVQVPSLSFTILVRKSMKNIFWSKLRSKLNLF